MAGKGRIIEKWDFTVNRIKVTVPVRIHTPEYSDQSTWFSVKYKYGEHTFTKQNESIDILRRELQAWLKDILTFKSEPFFYISFCGLVETQVGRTRGTKDEEVAGEIKSEFEWKRYLIGTTADGQKMYRDCSGLMNNGDWTKGEVMTGLQKNDFHFNWGTSMNALIPATKENEAGLKRLKEAFKALNKKLEAFLDPKMIEHNFAQIAGPMPLLLEVDHGKD